MATKPTATAATTDVQAVEDLVLWARSERIALSEVSVGTVRLVMADLHLASSLAPPRPTDEQLRDNLYKQFGGDALEEAAAETGDSDAEYDGSEEADE